MAGISPALGAPVCVTNMAEEKLLLVVDDGAGHRQTRQTPSGETVCLSVIGSVKKATDGVFADDTAEEGSSRLTRPGQREKLTGVTESDNCECAATDRSN